MPVEDVVSENVLTIVLTVRAADLPRVRELGAGCGCEAEVLSRWGPARLGKRLRRHAVLAVSGALVLMALFASSLFVWDIRVTGNDTDVPDGEILRVLAGQGVGVGSFYPFFRPDLIQARALRELPELSWLAVNIRGCRALVSVRGKTAAPDIPDPRQAADVAARRSGVVTQIQVWEGRPLCRRGSAVTRGELLISADTEDGRTVRARGRITGRTFREITAAAPLVSEQKQDAGRRKRRFSLLVGKKRINFFRDSGILPDDCDKIIHIWRPGGRGLLPFPAALVWETLQPFERRSASADAGELRTALESLLAGELRSRLEEDGEILSLRFTAAEGGGMLYVTAHAECEERLDREIPRENNP